MNVPAYPASISVTTRSGNTISLPAPRRDSDFSIERALHERRSVREFGEAALTQQEVSQLLWAAQGITSRDGLRTAPSAGALYPLVLYLAVGAVRDLDPGVYKYVPAGHRLMKIIAGDQRRNLAAASLGQDSVANAAAVLVFAAEERRTTRKYGNRGVRYIHIEVGHASQNVFLEATALGLAAVVVGAFDDDRLRETLKLPEGEAPLYLMPLGRP
ncbi:MAG: SagB/ThcOx family dehydrogenase [Gammaproteobacteria bacterium]|nr:SagB/ThcOx family dehydrogenase [Gammaproteobacteria bacterium]